MYPQNFFTLFPPYPRNNKVFVAMSFSKEFNLRWDKVVAPTIRKVQINGVSLDPYRVDASRISDSILTDILEGISSSRLILADITTIGNINGKPVRNGNVMYEIGIAQAIRLPEEVLLFRSDNDKILFDLTNIRVNSYDPDVDPIKASTILGDSLIETLSEIDHKKSLAVKHVVESLDYNCIWLLMQTAGSPTKTIDQPLIRTMRDVVTKTPVINTISRLLDLGLLTAQYLEITKKVIETVDLDAPIESKYRITPFGEAVAYKMAEKMGVPTLEKAKELMDIMSNHTSK